MKDNIENFQQKSETLEVLKMRDKMFMKLSHELRTPLNAIYGSAGLLAMSDKLDQKDREYINNILESTRALKKIVSNIIDYTQSIYEDVEVDAKEFSPQDIIEEIRTIISMKAQEKKLRFQIWIDPNIPRVMSGDVHKISRVLTHLLINSVKNTEQGEITLRILNTPQEKNGTIRYEVEDTGIGISKECLDTLFDAMDGEDDTIKVGIGLSICQEYVKAMNSELHCESTQGKGSRFWFDLDAEIVEKEPIVELKNSKNIKILIVTSDMSRYHFLANMCQALGVPHVQQWQESIQPAKEYYTHIMIDSEYENANQWLLKRMPYRCENLLILSTNQTYIDNMKRADRIYFEPFTIFMLTDILKRWNQSGNYKKEIKETLFQTQNARALVVDDNSVNLMIVDNILNQFGIQTDQADSGTLALQMHYNNKYDVIIMDYLMPGMDGVETTREIRAQENEESKAAIIALSANVTDDIRQRFLDAGAQDILAKPIELRELSRMLRTWLPADKIISSNLKTQQDEEQKNSSIIQLLQQIQGLDWQDAMGRMNINLDNYVKILGVSYENGMKQLKNIQEDFNEYSSANYKIYFHSLKGIFLNVGAKELSEEAQYLEAAVRKHDYEYLDSHFDAFEKKAYFFLEKIDAVIHSSEKPSAILTQQTVLTMSSDKLKQLILKLKSYIANYQFNEINEIIEIIHQNSTGENKRLVECAKAALQEFDYEKAGKYIENMTFE